MVKEKSQNTNCVTNQIYLVDVSAINAYFQAEFAGTPQPEFRAVPPLVNIRQLRNMFTEAQLEITFSAIFFCGYFLYVAYRYFVSELYKGMVPKQLESGNGVKSCIQD